MLELNLNTYVNWMRDETYVMYADCGTLLNTGETMTGYEMLYTIDEAQSWDETNVCPTDEGVTAKDLLLTLCLNFDIDYVNSETYDDLYCQLLEFINNISE